METAAEKNEKTEEIIDWNVDTEVQLFHAMKGHKPVGVNRYFQMACIHDKFSSSLNKDIHSRLIWDHLDTMYDMAALHESEILPFPNVEKDFALPDTDFRELLCQRTGNRPAENPPSSDDEQLKASSKPNDPPKKADTEPVKSAVKTPRQEQSSRKEAPQRSTSGKENPQRSTSGKVRPEHAHGKVRSDSTPTSKAKPEPKPKGEPQKSEKKAAAETKSEAKDSRTTAPKGEGSGGGTPKRAEQTHPTKEKGGRKSEAGRSATRVQEDTPAEKEKGKGGSGGGAGRAPKEESEGKEPKEPKRGATKRRQDPGGNKPPSPQVTGHTKRRR